jgi:hypothetical protein
MIRHFNWGTGLALTYLTFAAGTLSMVAIASSTRVDLVSADYYAWSLTVDQRMAAVANGQAIDVVLAFDSVDSATGIRVGWPPGTPRDAGGTLNLYRPSEASRDRMFAIALGSAGQEFIATPGVSPGHWQIQLAWTSGGLDYYVEREIVIP